MEKSSLENRKILALLLWILVVIFYFYLSYDYIRTTMADKELGEYIQHVIDVAGIEQRPAREVRALVLVKAEQLALPVNGDQVQVAGGGDTLAVSLDYSVDIEIPVIQRAVYSKQFQHRLKYRRDRY